MADKELFLQAEGVRDIALVRVPEDGTVHDVIDAAKAQGLRVEDGEDPMVTLENEEEALDLEAPLSAAGIVDRGRVHVHRCKRVEVTVGFNGRDKSDGFPPSATIKRVTRWAVGKQGFDLAEADAADHLLQLRGSPERPDEDSHIGTLVEVLDCSVQLDLVPKSRVEG